MYLLTSTPVHNSVEDLFSLFNLILSGYLGTEQEVSSIYNRKITDKNVSVMEERLESLHKKVLPFILRRLKTDHLKDLPPKIIKDILVDMNSSQSELYANIYSEIDTARANKEIDENAAKAESESSSKRVKCDQNSSVKFISTNDQDNVCTNEDNGYEQLKKHPSKKSRVS